MSKKLVGANRKQTEKAREIRTGKSAQRVWILSVNEEKEEERRGKEGDKRSFWLKLLSLPAWGVWIEIAVEPYNLIYRPGHSPHGECGLKYLHRKQILRLLSHSPHGECGLKLCF